MLLVRRRALFWIGALVPLVALCLFLALRYESQRILVGGDWSPEKLRQELTRRGVVYEGREVTMKDAFSRGLDPGYYLKRPGDSRSWDELASLIPIPANMRGVVIITARLPGIFQPTTTCDLHAGYVHLGQLVLHGDPAELRRILEALGYPIDNHPNRS